MTANEQSIKIAKLTDGSFLIGTLREDDSFLGYKIREKDRRFSLRTGDAPLLVPLHSIFALLPICFLDREDVLKICDVYLITTWKKTSDDEPKFIAKTGQNAGIAWIAGDAPRGTPILINMPYWRIHQHTDDVISVKFLRDFPVKVGGFLWWEHWEFVVREQTLEFCAKTGNLIRIDGKNYTPDADSDAYRIESIEHELPELGRYMP